MVWGPAFTGSRKSSEPLALAILTRSPLSVTSSSSSCEEAPLAIPSAAALARILRAYSASSGKLCRIRIPPRVPSADPPGAPIGRDLRALYRLRLEGLISRFPTANRLMRVAAAAYRSTSAGETPRASAMLSNPSLESSAGRSVAAFYIQARAGRVWRWRTRCVEAV